MTVVATLIALLWRVTLDDAYITFRYARHLAEGYGLGAWNHAGEHVEGYSWLLWTLLLAGADRLGVEIRLASKMFGVVDACGHRDSSLGGVTRLLPTPTMQRSRAAVLDT